MGGGRGGDDANRASSRFVALKSLRLERQLWGLVRKGMDPNGTGSEKGEGAATREKDGVYTWAPLPRRGFGRPEPDGTSREPTRRNIGKLGACHAR